MLRTRSLAVAVAAALAVGACVHRTAHAPLDSASSEPADRVRALVALDERVAAPAWRLAVANADLCPVTRLRAGWTLHAAAQYGAETRPAAETLYGLDSDLPGVSAIAPGSPAASAGLAAGDLILAVEDRTLSRSRTDAPARYDGLEANIRVLNDALRRGPVRLRVRRAGVERIVNLTPVRACAYETQVEVTGTLRSRADGRRIFVSDGFLAILPDDAALAFLLAHELAHNVLGHRAVADLTGDPGPLNGSIRMRKGLSPTSEADADKAGLWLLARAGYDLRAGLGFFDAYRAAYSGARYPQINAGGIYASAPERKRALLPVIAEIEAQRAEGGPLVP